MWLKKMMVDLCYMVNVSFWLVKIVMNERLMAMILVSYGMFCEFTVERKLW